MKLSALLSLVAIFVFFEIRCSSGQLPTSPEDIKLLKKKLIALSVIAQSLRHKKLLLPLPVPVPMPLWFKKLPKSEPIVLPGKKYPVLIPKPVPVYHIVPKYFPIHHHKKIMVYPKENEFSHQAHIKSPDKDIYQMSESFQWPSAVWPTSHHHHASEHSFGASRFPSMMSSMAEMDVDYSGFGGGVSSGSESFHDYEYPVESEIHAIPFRKNSFQDNIFRKSPKTEDLIMSAASVDQFQVPSETELYGAGKLPNGIRISPDEIKAILGDLKSLNDDIKMMPSQMMPSRGRQPQSMEQPVRENIRDIRENIRDQIRDSIREGVTQEQPVKEYQGSESSNQESSQVGDGDESNIRKIQIGEIRLKPEELRQIMSADGRDELVFEKRGDEFSLRRMQKSDPIQQMQQMKPIIRPIQLQLPAPQPMNHEGHLSVESVIHPQMVQHPNHNPIYKPINQDNQQ